MAENYYYSSLSGDEIESRLVGGVVFNADQTLTTSEKARARANIGAGESDSTFKILGYYGSYEDLIQGLQLPPQPGDAYGIGTASPYDVYVYDGIHNTWVNNGPIVLSDAVIDDEDIALGTTWSSDKINTELSEKQGAIAASGMLKGDGNGGVTAATPGTDYLTHATNYSPVKFVDADLPNNPYYIIPSDIGKTITIGWLSNENLDRRLILTLANSSQMPVGTEIALAYFGWANSATIEFQDNLRVGAPGNPVAPGQTYRFAEIGMVALKKITNVDGGGNDLWILTGNVEVV